MKNIDDLLKGDYNVNIGLVLQEILGRVIANNLLTSEAIRRLMILEKKQEGLAVEDDEINAELSRLTEILAEHARKQVNSLTATWHLKSE